MDIEIIALDEARLDEAAALWHAGWHDGHAAIVPEALTRLRTRDSMRHRLAARIAATRLAVRGDALLGFHILEGDELYQFYVAAEARGTGVAARLMMDAEAGLRRAGHDAAWLACSVGNTRAARFYEKSGWVNAGRRIETVETSQGGFDLPVWRFEKALG